MAGFEPNRDKILLSRGADFVHQYDRDKKDPPFPEGTTAEIVFTSTTSTSSPVIATWPAEDVTEDSVLFWIQSTSADQIADRTPYRLLVHYPPAGDGAETQDFVWFYGTTARKQ